MSEHHDEDTLSKVYSAMAAVGLGHQECIEAVSDMQNNGILFRERGPVLPEGVPNPETITILRDSYEELIAKPIPLYCENEDCMVLIYQSQRTEHVEFQVDTNCPGCGRFGRKKG